MTGDYLAFLQLIDGGPTLLLYGWPRTLADFFCWWNNFWGQSAAFKFSKKIQKNLSITENNSFDYSKIKLRTSFFEFLFENLNVFQCFLRCLKFEKNIQTNVSATLAFTIVKIVLLANIADRCFCKKIPFTRIKWILEDFGKSSNLDPEKVVRTTHSRCSTLSSGKSHSLALCIVLGVDVKYWTCGLWSLCTGRESSLTVKGFFVHGHKQPYFKMRIVQSKAGRKCCIEGDSLWKW